MKQVHSMVLAMVFIMTFSTSALGGGNPDASPAAASSAQKTYVSDSSHVYTVQVASFKELWRARNMAAYLDINGFDTAVMLLKGKGDTKWYVVRSGEYQGYRTAKKKAWAIEDFVREGTLVRKMTPAFLAERNVPTGIQLARSFEIKRTVTRTETQTVVKTTAQAVPQAVPQTASKPAPMKIARKPLAKKTPELAQAPKAAPDRTTVAQGRGVTESPAAVVLINHETHRKLAQKGLSVTLRSTDAGKAVQVPAQTARAYPPAGSKAEPQTKRIFTVQVASFNRPERAKRMVEILGKNGFDAYAVSMFGWHVIHSGEFTTYAQAKQRQTDLKKVTKDATLIRDLDPNFVARHKDRFLLASTPAPSHKIVPKTAPKSTIQHISKAEPKAATAPDLKVKVSPRAETAEKSAHKKMLTVAKFTDPGQAGKTARALRKQGIPSTVVYMGGSEPWYVVQNGGETITRPEALVAIQAAEQ